MPLPVKVVAPPPPPLPTRPTVGQILPVWVPPDGSDPVPLNPDGAAHITLDAWSGVTGAAPIRITTDIHPRGGAHVRHIQPQARTIIWPLRFRSLDHMGLLLPWREMAGKFTQTRRFGPGLLRLHRPDGTAREIAAIYEGGFDGESGQGWLEDTAVIQLLCPDPYWRDLTVRSVSRTHSDGVDFYDPFLGVSRGSVLGETTIHNNGSVEAWPEWEITGPASLITCTNHTTGEQFILDPDWDDDGPLEPEDTIQVTTDPPGVVGPAGEVWTGALNWPGAVLWGLRPGRNDVEFQVDGSAQGTEIRLSWQTRHETA